MKLSTMVNLFYSNTPDEKGYLNAVRKTYDVGFRTMDFTMCPMQRGATELNGDNWEKITYEVGNEAAKLGVEFAQSHLPYPKANVRRKLATDPGCELNEDFIAVTERAIRISGMLGVKWAVVHPVMRSVSAVADFEDSIKYNHEIYDKYLELASSLGVGLAFENMADVDGKRRFCATSNELVELIKDFNCPEYVGACWDFGHANRMVPDQTGMLKEIMPYLRATHVDDNLGKDDLHTLPYLGNINWEQVMTVLGQGGYDGAFNYEIKYTAAFPEPLKHESAVFAYHVGQYLVSLAENAAKAK